MAPKRPCPVEKSKRLSFYVIDTTKLPDYANPHYTLAATLCVHSHATRRMHFGRYGRGVLM